MSKKCCVILLLAFFPLHIASQNWQYADRAEGHYQGESGQEEGHYQGEPGQEEGHYQGESGQEEGHYQGEPGQEEGHSQGEPVLEEEIQEEPVRKLGFPKGSAFKCKWLFGPAAFNSLTHLTLGFLITHQVKLKFKDLYRDAYHKEAYHKEPADLDFVEYIDENLLDQKHLAGRIGFLPPDNNFSPNQTELPYLRNKNHIVISPHHHKNHIKKIKQMDKFYARKDRLYIYHDLEDVLHSLGIEGKDCILRAICEIADEPIVNSLFGALLNVLFSPSMGGMPEFEDERQDYQHYLDAELFGRSSPGQCHHKFDECSFSTFSAIVSFVENVLM